MESTGLLAVLTPIALFDSTSITPLCIVPLVVLFSGKRPTATASAFLLGIFLTYVVCSLVLLLGLQSVFEELNELVTDFIHKHPDTLDLVLQGIIGLAMVFFGSRMADARESEDDRGLADDVTPTKAFTGGAVLTLVGMPGAFPLFAAADQILRADLDLTNTVAVVLFYNVVFIAPLTAVVLLRSVLGKRSDALLARINVFVSTWGHRVVVWGLILLGGTLVVDAIGWSFGWPIIPIGAAAG
jgi:cytochrome c biogenesis protein CcdA